MTKKRNYPANRKNWTAEDDAEFRSMYVRGVEIMDMAEHFGVSRTTVHSRRKALKIPARGRGGPKTRPRSRSVPSVYSGIVAPAQSVMPELEAINYEVYDPAVDRPVLRPGSQQFLQIPSLQLRRRYFRDGRVEDAT